MNYTVQLLNNQTVVDTFKTNLEGINGILWIILNDHGNIWEDFMNITDPSGQLLTAAQIAGLQDHQYYFGNVEEVKSVPTKSHQVCFDIGDWFIACQYDTLEFLNRAKQAEQKLGLESDIHNRFPVSFMNELNQMRTSQDQ